MPVEFLDLADLEFGAGGYLLLRQALIDLPPGRELFIRADDPLFEAHCRAWCRARGIEFFATDAGNFRLKSPAVESGYLPAGENGAVAEIAPRDWGLATRGARVEAGVAGYSFPFRKREQVWSERAARCYRLAATRQWNPESLDWGQSERNHPVIEAAIVQVMTYLIENETAALVIPARFAAQVHPHYHETVQFLAIQAADEARHIEVFRRRALLYGMPLGVSSRSGQESLLTLVAESDFEIAGLLLSVMGEGTFLTLLIYMGRYAPDALTRRICRLAACDEARHVAFAMAHLAPHAGDAERLARYRAAIERRFQALSAFSSLSEEVHAALHLTLAGGLDAESLRAGDRRMRKMRAEMTRGRAERLKKLGFAPAEATRLAGLHTRNFM